MKRAQIHSAGPWITGKEVEYVNDAIQNGWYDENRGYIDAFEKAFAKYLGVRYALATSHGTGALHLALAASGVSAGDEVIVPDISWIATANVVRHCGAEPVFVDVRPGDWTIDPNRIEAAITPRTKAIFPVHLYGHPADMDAIESIANANGLMVIEDAAPAVGSTYKGRKMGTFGRASGFSFQGAKLLATGQGGMMVTDDEEIFRRAVRVYEHGRQPERGVFFSGEVGYNFKMANLVAAMGLAQLERVDELVARKLNVYQRYKERLAGLNGVVMQLPGPHAVGNGSNPSILIDPDLADRDHILSELSRRNIDTRVAFPRMSSMPSFQITDTPVSKRVEENGLNLPTPAYLDDDDIALICDALTEIIDKSAKR